MRLAFNRETQTHDACGSTMADIPHFIPLEEAVRLANEVKIVPETEEVGLDSSHQRILAIDLESKVDDPAFDNSAMDGFAMRYEDTLNPPSRLKISGLSKAGGSGKSIQPGEAARIMTGAPLPEGADAILQIELCEVEGSEVVLKEEGKKHFIRKQGENLSKGVVSLTKGSYLSPSRIGLCATMGHAKIPVYKPLKVAIISTGDELIQPGENLGPGQIYESNSFGLAGLVRWLGHEPVRYTRALDSMDDTRNQLNQAASECDLILTSGGVSMGEFDFVRRIMEEEGDLRFWRVRIRPGSPPLFGLWRETPIFGLPGNPVSSHVVFRMLVAPWIRNCTGADGPIEHRTRAKLSTKVKSTKDCVTLRRVSVEQTSEGLVAKQQVHQGSGNLASMATSDALTLLSPGEFPEIGDDIEVILL